VTLTQERTVGWADGTAHWARGGKGLDGLDNWVDIVRV
jgi:hypothetical protein